MRELQRFKSYSSQSYILRDGKWFPRTSKASIPSCRCLHKVSISKNIDGRAAIYILCPYSVAGGDSLAIHMSIRVYVTDLREMLVALFGRSVTKANCSVRLFRRHRTDVVAQPLRRTFVCFTITVQDIPRVFGCTDLIAASSRWASWMHVWKTFRQDV